MNKEDRGGIPGGVNLFGNNKSIVAASSFGTHIYRPVLQPTEVLPLIGTYTMKNTEGEVCIKASLGAQYIVIIQKKRWFFNLDPLKVLASGSCHRDLAVLSLTIPNNGASLQFTFKKENNHYYVTRLLASLIPQPVCLGCANKTYSGLVSRSKLFAASYGRSFTCKSANVVLTSSEMSINMVPVHMQAFGVPNGQYGEVEECLADFIKRTVPVIVLAIGVGLLMIAVVTLLLLKEHRMHGYERF
ncbi:lysosome-associated membrane glycoprotein 3 isoform X2 [Syngnathoides biaculeatus]|uniref:lysosome-associated membrane glycoprotein 3 isoform X2 n=1 Tax=Syngnathoides biaculeatus TaxID=300417 RepID=UPI002ADE8862|nr:lysosome-associated membrane glycoprotein 3 isoform X2 [Syngnathoides biaculeatus]XP_061681307.1 lysosome-associated membrane glycoprotein 3 isoform X2 [Syngnathoides biaculeatus]XP_061681308.1 lysosome-associated membrane glycoprotein 3 isoform X2 [Syngnathoides biaculeatus]XP_061681309.1 lysosome-associated membrane glycoprotein 3 isoform X2 [Syngnathoides biaculeatus]